MTTNRRLKQARELRGWSQAKIAELIGTDATTVSRWERGLFSPTPYFRERLCVLFGKNAEELGLLEIEGRPLVTGRVYQTEKEGHANHIDPLIPPSWPERDDTFTYILHSAMHDQQAHILWEDAYVRALLGQYTEAQQLGEASLSAFERVGHLNATAVREWLNQCEFASLSPSSANIPHVPPMSLPAHSEQGKRPTKHIVRGLSAGIEDH